MSKTITEEQIFAVPVRFLVLPIEFIGNLAGVTPSVKNCKTFRCSGVVVTVTNFTEGADGQAIHLLGDGTTTISNNANIKTNTGANKLLAANKMYHFTLISNVWYEDA